MVDSSDNRFNNRDSTMREIARIVAFVLCILFLAAVAGFVAIHARATPAAIAGAVLLVIAAGMFGYGTIQIVRSGITLMDRKQPQRPTDDLDKPDENES